MRMTDFSSTSQFLSRVDFKTFYHDLKQSFSNIIKHEDSVRVHSCTKGMKTVMVRNLNIYGRPDSYFFIIKFDIKKFIKLVVK